MNVVARPPLSQLLRESTREVHERVEQASDLNRWIVVRIPSAPAPATAAEAEARARARADYRIVYREFLLAAHGFEAAAHASLATSPAREEAMAAGWEDESPPASELIRTDLVRAFGAGAADGLPVAPGLPQPRTLAEFAGLEYVRRGSRAGAAVIGAVVAHNLGLGREDGAGFLLRYGRGTRAVLDALRSWLDGLGLDEAGMRAATASAAATFAAVENWHRSLDGSAPRLGR